MGQARLEQQQAEEMKERVKDYQLHQLAIQNDTDVRTERVIQQGNEQPEITRGASISGERTTQSSRQEAGDKRDGDLNSATNIAMAAGKAGLGMLVKINRKT